MEREHPEMKWFLGFDTSAYTTSVAAVDEQGRLLGEKRQLLTVPLGKRGLQQSQAVFQHLQNLPNLVQDLHLSLPQLVPHQLAGIAVSAQPRPIIGSYMPVFQVGMSFASCLSAVHRVFCKLTSHQEGHFAAGVYAAKGPTSPAFLGVHLSGGTSEILLVQRKPAGYTFEILGKTLDLHAGQFIDRVGVSLGFPFPAGSNLEILAAAYRPDGITDSIFLPAVVRDYDFSFSGPETQAQRLIAQGILPEKIARATENCVAKTIEKVLRRAIQDTCLREVLIVGGVAANQYLRQKWKQRLEHPAIGARLYFATPSLSADSAVGIALLAWDHWKESR